jgi:hypothetical protein
MADQDFAAVIARRRQTWPVQTKPKERGLRLDLSHPLANGMLVCLPFFEGRGNFVEDHARRTTYNVGGLPSLGPYVFPIEGDNPVLLPNTRIAGGLDHNTQWESVQGQLGCTAGGNLDGWEIGYEGTNLRLPTNRATILLATRLQGTYNRVIFGFESGTSASDLSATFVFTGTITWAVGSQNVTTPVVSQTDILTYLAFTAGPTGQRIYASNIGVLAQTSTPPSRVATLGGVFYLSAGTHPVVFFAILDAEWSEGQVKQWWSAPWDWFRTPSHARRNQSVHSFTYKLPGGVVSNVRRPGFPFSR